MHATSLIIIEVEKQNKTQPAIQRDRLLSCRIDFSKYSVFNLLIAVKACIACLLFSALDGGDTNRIMGIDTYTTVVIIASAIFFYRAAKYDGSSAVLWVVLSVVVSLLLLTLLRLGWVGIILGQVGLFLGITIFRVIRDS